MSLAEQIHNEAISLWFKLEVGHHAEGHPGEAGPSGHPNEKWDSDKGHLLGALATLKIINERIK